MSIATYCSPQQGCYSCEAFAALTAVASAGYLNIERTFENFLMGQSFHMMIARLYTGWSLAVILTIEIVVPFDNP